MSLKALWNKITNIGVDEFALGREIVKARLLNQLIVITLITSLMALVTYIIFFEGYAIIFTTTANIALELTGLILCFRKQHITVRYIASFAFPTLIAIHIIILGGNFGEANIFLAMGFTAFILFEYQRRIQIAAVIYICLLFISTKFYIINYDLVSAVKDNPYDEIITFPMMLLVLGMIILIYQREVKKYEEQKSKLIKDLKNKNQELEEFTYIASHDLKTPLRTISSYLDLGKINLEKGAKKEAISNLNAAKGGTVQLYALINDILEFKRISQDNIESHIMDLNEVIKNISENLEPAFKGKEIKIDFKKLPTIKANKNEVVALFQNLIENGLKYNNSTTPSIRISHELTKEYINIAIEDNGIGIAQVHHEKIFKFFNRLHRPEVYEGSGIGLGLCKKIIQKYEGDISIDSEEGRGAIFLIKLPIKMLVRA